jgi:antitoxin ParD1/3/4
MDFGHVGRRAVEGRCGGGSMTRDGGVMRLGHPTPQSDGVIDADVVGQVPVAQAVVRVGHRCLLSVWWNMGLAKFCQRTYACAMSTMNISLPDTLKSFVDEQVSQRGYGTSSEYVRELIRKDQDRLQLRNLLLAGVASAPVAPADVSYFEGLRDRVRKAAKPAAKA